MQIPLSSIKEGSRIRSDYGDLESLKSSLSTLGQLQSILVDDNLNLIAGGRRFRAMQQLGWESCEIIMISDVSESELRTMELEENIQRKDMTWQEQCINIRTIVRAQQKRAAVEGDKYTLTQAGLLLGLKHSMVGYHMKIADLIDARDEEILACDNVHSAIKILLARAEAKAYEYKNELTKAAVIARRDETLEAMTLTNAAPQSLPELGKDLEDFPGLEGLTDLMDFTSASPIPQPNAFIPSTSTRQHCINADSVFVHLPSMPDRCVDHIITDPPYGIDMNDLDTNTRLSVTRSEHDVDENISLFAPFLTQAYRVLRDKGFCIFFFDLQHFEKLSKLALSVGFTMQDWPLIWHKTTPTRNSAAHVNWNKNYESIMVLRKGVCTLNKVQSSSILLGGLTSDERNQFHHPFTKPFNIIKQLADAIGIPGQTILDPFAGEFSIVCHLLRLGYNPIGIEKIEVHYIKGLHHVENTLNELLNP